MSTEQYTYVGPFIRLHLKPMEVKVTRRFCPGGHKRQETNQYCNKCGSKIQTGEQPKSIRGGFREFLDAHPELDYDSLIQEFQVVSDEYNQTYQTLIPLDRDRVGDEFDEKSFTLVVDPTEADDALIEFDKAHRELINTMDDWSKVEVHFGVIGYRW